MLGQWVKVLTSAPGAVVQQQKLGLLTAVQTHALELQVWAPSSSTAP